MSDTTLPEWNARDAVDFINAEGERIDREHFASDIAYLHSVADYILEAGVPGPRTTPADTTIEEQLLDQTPFEARRDMFDLVLNPPTFERM